MMESNGRNHRKFVTSDDSDNASHEDRHGAYRALGTIPALEEQIRMHETTLNAWRQRRDHILLENDKVLQRKQTLLNKREILKERRRSLCTARGQHKSLQQNLQESLAKSRERLQRLTRLEAMDEESFRDRDGEEDSDEHTSDAFEFQEDNDGIDMEDNEEQTVALVQRESQEDKTVANEETNEAGTLQDNTYKVDSKQVSARLWTNWFSEAGSCNDAQSGLSDSFAGNLNCFPPLSAEQVREYITLSVREANALDLEENLGKSLRRNLLDRTCLDIRVLLTDVTAASPTVLTNNQLGERSNGDPMVRQDSVESIGTETSSEVLNPNLSLCPYELAGICADEFCPYQHTDKATKVLARERLPLPSLTSFWLATEENQAGVFSPAQVVSETKSSITTRIDRTATHDPASKMGLEATILTSSQRRDEEENYLELPAIASTNGDDDSQTDITSESSGDEDVDVDEHDENDDNEPLLFDSTRFTHVLPTHLDDDSFWWGGKLCNRDDILQESETKAKKVENSYLSLHSVLRDTFGVMLRPEEVGKNDHVEIMIEPPMIVSSSGPPSDFEILGRLMDASRLALHGGRCDIAITLCQVLRKGDVFDSHRCKTIFRPYSDFLEAQVRNSLDGRYATTSLFAVQVSMAILCWSLSNVGSHVVNSADFSKDESSVSAILGDTCTECQRVLRYEAPTSYASSGQDTLHKLLSGCRSDHHGGKTLHSDSASNVNTLATSTQAQLLNLRDSAVWSQKSFSIGPFDSLASSEQRLDDRLKSLWTEVKKSLHSPAGEYGVRTGVYQKQNYVFRCLKGIIFVGYAVFGVLSSFVQLLDQNDDRIENKRLSVSVQAAWTLIDGVIYQILKDLRRCVAGMDLLEQLLAPLFAASIASAAFLRSYATAQRRLEKCLGGHHRTPKNELSSSRRTTVLQFSELLWSQLVQLRMTLPLHLGSLSSLPTSPSKREITRMPRESSTSVQDENKMLCDKLQSMEIRLLNVSLWGDWILRSLANEYQKRMHPALGWIFLSLKEKYSISDVGKSTLTWKTDVLDRLTNGSGGIQGRQFPPPLPLSPLPLLLLNLGHHLIKLDLSNSKLGCLPHSFGLYFPNLEILDLSFNNLTYLPNSFQSMICHMRCLYVFRAQHNFFESLPVDIFSTTEGVHSLSSNPPSAYSLRSPLRIVDLSHNRLSSLPPLISNLHHIEELFLDHNALVTMTVVDISRLVTALPALRLLTYEPQQVAPID